MMHITIDPRPLTALLCAGALSQPAAASPDFDFPMSITALTQPVGVALADFDNDGTTDLATTTRAGAKIGIYFNKDGMLSDPVFIQTGTGTNPDELLASDLDNDGDQDLVVVLKDIDAVRVYLNDAGSFSKGITTSVGSAPSDLAKGHLRFATRDDFVVVNRDSGSFSLLTNLGGALSSASYAAGEEPASVATGDFDADGTMDIAIGDRADGSVTIRSGVRGYAPTQTLEIGAATPPNGLVGADFDGDGLTDLAATLGGADPNVVAIWFNTGGALGGRVDVEVNGSGVYRIDAADLDADGDLDLVTTNRGSNSMSILENLGGGFFAQGDATPTGTNPSNIAIADIDGNGGPDIAIANTGSSSISIFSNLSGAGPCSLVDLAAPFGELNFFDVSDFLDAYNSGDPAADIDASGQINFFDINAYLDIFAQGCP